MEEKSEMSTRSGVVSPMRPSSQSFAPIRLAAAYLKAALESLDVSSDIPGALLALRAVAEAHGGLRKVAAEAGITRESLYRALSPKGNPTLKTLLAITRAVGFDCP